VNRLSKPPFVEIFHIACIRKVLMPPKMKKSRTMPIIKPKIDPMKTKATAKKTHTKMSTIEIKLKRSPWRKYLGSKCPRELSSSINLTAVTLIVIQY
jgi:hypothetical protein